MARHRERRQLILPDAVVLDSEGLSAAAAGSARVRAELILAERLGASVHVSAVTLTETLRGGPRDARVHSLLKSVVQRPVTPELGRAAGELLGRTDRADTVDAIVAATAGGLGQRVRILTSDPRDLRALTAEMDAVTVVAV
jgi:predicted nucleic acid-binding protein